jgi:hypothetical protein
MAAADDAHAEPGEHQDPGQGGDRSGIALGERRGRVEQCRLVLRLEQIRRLAVAAAVQEVAEQPVGLRRGAADRIAEPRPDQAQRCCAQDRGDRTAPRPAPVRRAWS